MPRKELYGYSKQPAKQIYLAYQLFTTIFFRLPIWFLLAVPKSRRPRPTWPLKRALFLRLFRHFMYITSQTGPIYTTPNHLAITPGVGIEGVWIPPADNFITKSLKSMAEVSKVSPMRIPGYWVHRKGSKIEFGSPPAADEKVVLSFHGGAYIRYSAHPDDATATIAKGLLKHVASVQRLFCVEYRLSKTSAGYHYLVNILHVSPSDIIVEGDSAGGNLALALTRYLVSNTTNLPVPSSLLLLSPWCDIGLSHDMPRSSSILKLHAGYDPEPHGVDDAKRAFLGSNGWGAAEINPYISPASRNPGLSIHFKGFPPTFIVAGGAENLAPQIRLLRDRMQKDLGSKLKYLEADGGSHDYIIFSWQEPERSEALEEIADWTST
ncbi:Alpha/Beta hydrolase protein [Armillaria mellea]|nr:Alpha/Beta hydrolase protein [Armillaria mellea]